MSKYQSFFASNMLPCPSPVARYFVMDAKKNCIGAMDGCMLDTCLFDSSLLST